MSTNSCASTSPQSESCANSLSLASHDKLALSIFQSSQRSWMDEDRTQASADDDAQITPTADSLVDTSALSPPLGHPLEVDECVITPQATDNDEQRFGEFVSACTDPFKQPTFSIADDDDDETCPLLNIDSETGVEVGILAGIGVVQPTFARLDLPTRHVRQAGKSMERKWQILQGMRLARSQTLDQSAAVSDHPAPKTFLEELAGSAREAAKTTDTIKQQQANRSVVPAASLDWVMRPVSFATLVSKEIQRELVHDLEENVKAESAAWNDSAV